MNYFQLGDFIQKENISLEHKEFCLKDIDERKITETFDNIFTTNTQQLCHESLMYYSKKVMPKYVSAFTHLNGDDKRGVLYIGVDDMGQITGIPYLKTTKEHKIPKDKIIQNISDNIRIIKDENILLSASQKTQYLKKRLKLSRIECVCDHNVLNDDYQKLYDTLKHKKKEIMKILEEYHTQKQIWHRRVRQYTIKMKIIANKKSYRKETIRYINKYCEDPILKKTHIDRLKDETPLNVPKSKIFKHLKLDPNSVFYWIVSWKDFMIQKLSIYKPKHPMPPSLPYQLRFLRKRLTLHRKRWLLNTPNIGYYVLKMKICRSTKYNIEYKDKKHNTWISVTRKNNSTIGPYCDHL